jgi:hypothetical protein
MSRLSSGFPGTITAPLSPPFVKASFVCIWSFPFALPSMWHCTQLASRTGAMSLVKSIAAEATDMVTPEAMKDSEQVSRADREIMVSENTGLGERCPFNRVKAG